MGSQIWHDSLVEKSVSEQSSHQLKAHDFRYKFGIFCYNQTFSQFDTYPKYLKNNNKERRRNLYLVRFQGSPMIADNLSTHAFQGVKLLTHVGLDAIGT